MMKKYENEEKMMKKLMKNDDSPAKVPIEFAGLSSLLLQFLRFFIVFSIIFHHFFIISRVA